MIITETITRNGKQFIHNYSSLGNYIERDGIKYGDAVDLPEMGYTYTETDEALPNKEAALQEKAEAYDIILGVSK